MPINTINTFSAYDDLAAGNKWYFKKKVVSNWTSPTQTIIYQNMVPCSIQIVLNMLFETIYINNLSRDCAIYNKNIDFKTMTIEIQHLAYIYSTIYSYRN